MLKSQSVNQLTSQRKKPNSLKPNELKTNHSKKEKTNQDTELPSQEPKEFTNLLLKDRLKSKPEHVG